MQLLNTGLEWRYNNQGGFSGFDLTVLDNSAVVLEASIDIERAPSGRVLSYSGTVSTLDSPSYFENVQNNYNEFGGLIGANVSKTYTASNNDYLMEITQYCPNAMSPNITGYKVQIANEEHIVGICSQ